MASPNKVAAVEPTPQKRKKRKATSREEVLQRREKKMLQEKIQKLEENVLSD